MLLDVLDRYGVSCQVPAITPNGYYNDMLAALVLTYLLVGFAYISTNKALEISFKLSGSNSVPNLLSSKLIDECMILRHELSTVELGSPSAFVSPQGSPHL